MLGRDAKKVTVSLFDTANMRDASVERADNLNAQLAARARREDAHRTYNLFSKISQEPSECFRNTSI